jgi:hypothetical protein
MKTAPGEEVYGGANMTADKRVEFQVHWSGTETEPTTCSIADTDYIANELEGKIYCIISNEPIRFQKDLYIRLFDFTAWETAIVVQDLRKIIKQSVIHFGYPKTRHWSHISHSIWRIGSHWNFTTDMSKWLHIGNLKEAYRSTCIVNYIRQIPKHNDWCTGHDYMVETLAYLAIQGYYDIDSANVCNLLSATDEWRNTPRAHLIHT